MVGDILHELAALDRVTTDFLAFVVIRNIENIPNRIVCF